ncbi:hypothetical protein DFJ74DRAFT_695476 [Hyaloraphidium curvatum]|nr:hypothetical protein DFJ74DRAFT_695476 [Hyaloraphidium curvatum]
MRREFGGLSQEAAQGTTGVREEGGDGVDLVVDDGEVVENLPDIGAREEDDPEGDAGAGGDEDHSANQEAERAQKGDETDPWGGCPSGLMPLGDESSMQDCVELRRRLPGRAVGGRRCEQVLPRALKQGSEGELGGTVDHARAKVGQNDAGLRIPHEGESDVVVDNQADGEKDAEQQAPPEWPEPPPKVDQRRPNRKENPHAVEGLEGQRPGHSLPGSRCRRPDEARRAGTELIRGVVGQQGAWRGLVVGTNQEVVPPNEGCRGRGQQRAIALAKGQPVPEVHKSDPEQVQGDESGNAGRNVLRGE